MALPRNKPVLPDYPQEVFGRYRAYVIELIEQIGFVAARSPGGDYLVIGGFVRFQHPSTEIRVWVSQRYVRVCQDGGVKKFDIAWYGITNVKQINKLVSGLVMARTAGDLL